MPRPTRLRFTSLLILAALTTASGASAQTAPKAQSGKAQPPAAKTAPPTATPAPAPGAASGYHVDGFRSARFGMTQDEVRAAVTKDFNLAPTAFIATQNAIDQTSAISIKLDHLDPGPGQAYVSFIFGASKKTLMHINVAWRTDAKPTDDQRKAIITAALQLASYFQQQAWPPNRTVSGALLPGNTVLIFEGVDAPGSGVEVTTSGVPLESADPKAPKMPDPTGPAQLMVSYSADHDHPDVVKIPQGAF
jgi:hypothetical protein